MHGWPGCGSVPAAEHEEERRTPYLRAGCAPPGFKNAVKRGLRHGFNQLATEDLAESIELIRANQHPDQAVARVHTESDGINRPPHRGRGRPRPHISLRHMIRGGQRVAP